MNNYKAALTAQLAERKDMNKRIYFMEKNIHGAYVVHGIIGIKHYYGYTKKEAYEMYLEEVKNTIIVRK